MSTRSGRAGLRDCKMAVARKLNLLTTADAVYLGIEGTGMGECCMVNDYFGSGQHVNISRKN